LPAVSVRVDGLLHERPAGLPRADVHNAFADERLAGAGWSFKHTWQDPDAEHWVEFTAHSARGECALLHAGLLGCWAAGQAVLSLSTTCPAALV
jgi:hypothetical protein